MSAEVDTFSLELLEEAKRFVEKAAESETPTPYLHAAMLLSFSALESHINGLAEELLLRPGLDLMDKSIMAERDVKLTDGSWALGKDVKYFRLEDRLKFIFARFGSVDVRATSWWSTLHEAIDRRNALVHPRDVVELRQEDAERFLLCIIEALDDLYQSTFGRGHPSRRRGLQSTLNF